MKRFDYVQAVILGLIAGFCVQNTYHTTPLTAAVVTRAAAAAVCAVRRLDERADGTEKYRESVEAGLAETARLLACQSRSFDEQIGRLEASMNDMGEERGRQAKRQCEAVIASVNEIARAVDSDMEALKNSSSKIETAIERATEAQRKCLETQLGVRFDALLEQLDRKLADLKKTASAAKAIEELCQGHFDESLKELGEIKSSLAQMNRGLANTTDAERELVQQYRELQNAYIKEMIRLGEQSKDIVGLMNDSYKCLNLAAKKR